MSYAVGLLKDLIWKYRLEQPVPADVRSHMRAVKRAVLVDVLRRAGNYSFYFGILLRLYFRARGMGIVLSLGACAAVFWFLLAAGVAGISAGAYAAAVFLSDGKTEVHSDIMPDEKNAPEETVNQALPGREEKIHPSAVRTVTKGARTGPERKGKQVRAAGSDTQKEPESKTPGDDTSRDEEYEGKAKNIPTL